MMRKILTAALALFVIIQFLRPARDNNDASAQASNINNFLAVPADIDQTLKTSCYDCHSNRTNYPWYSAVQPFGWWLDHHVYEGKKELNFDAFGGYSLRRQFHKLEEVEEMIEEDEMPLSSYTLIHRGSKLSPEQKRQLITWSEKARAEMSAKYPADSLKAKK
ncbi:heme-binding domain-containing protein [Flavihumibacter petaseus]|uniref:Haem-binding domain-containing protein n=1 Tax=Flavihumibacter petaseus NBRC 106054 TaxID=1220578 RepID=A0A0E9N6Z2_9BACT|nr:heme-binding domain-containing protein [Flavihumibacter petaseus]GAO45115.1 hypothetical protein FPE01S_04_03580 [Flavihumibacter petaseus NBRC 106054]